MSAGSDGAWRGFAARRPEAPALDWPVGPDGSAGHDDRPGPRWTHGELDRAVEGTAAALTARGVRPGERLAWCLPKGPAAVLVHLAALRVGAVSVPLNPRATDAERAHPLADARPALVVHDGRVADVPAEDAWIVDPGSAPAPSRPASPPRDVADHAPACLIYTSGTTGRPKGAVLTHGGLTANDAALRRAWAFDADDHLLHVLPLFHVHGLFVALHLALGSGARVSALPEFDAGPVWRLLGDAAVSVFMAVPTMHHRLLAAAPGARVELPHLRLVTSGSAPLRAETLDAFERLTGHRILERYGMTEVGMAVSNPYDGERRAGTVGLDLPGMTTRIVDGSGTPVAAGEIGEVQIRGPSVFAGYWERPEATAAAFSADGWLRSGDLGRRDEAGYLVLVGRAKELIISGGFNVHPGEVEAVLLARDEVAEAAVCGLPDDDLGERVVAAVVPAPGRPVDTAALLAHCREQLSGYKRPRAVHVVDQLPRNAMGKLQRARLAEQLAGCA